MQKSILVVDDSMVSRLMVKSIIGTEFPDANIFEAASGDDALDKIKSVEHIDIALVDFNMPGFDGLELFSRLADAVNIEKKALLTANIQENIKQRTESAGITFINKPINEDAIRAFISG